MKIVKPTIGEKIGRLTIISSMFKNHNQYVNCLCDCGGSACVVLSKLKRGLVLSCGCLRIEAISCAPGDASFNELFRICERDAARRGLRFCLTEDQHKQLIQLKCFYCGEEPHKFNVYLKKDGTLTANTTRRGGIAEEFIKRAAITINGIDRVNEDPMVGYDVCNSNPSCKFCNFGRNNTPFDEWIAYLKRRAYWELNPNKDLLEKQLQEYLKLKSSV